jgi:hypothetical protein
MVILAPKQIPEIQFAKDEILSFHTANHKLLQPIYTIPDPSWLHSTYPIPALKKFLSRNLHLLTSEIAQEVSNAFDTHWWSANNTNDWVIVSLWDAIYGLSVQSISRLFAGESASRNRTYTRLIREHIKLILISAVVLNVFPDYLRP